MKNSIKTFSIINTLEGYSYLLLLFVAMPLKYVFGFPLAVKLAGMTHGVLFIAFVFLLIAAWKEAQWGMKENMILFVASLIPFGTFFTKKRIVSYIK